MPLLSAQNDFGLWALMLILVALTLKVEKTPAGSRLGGPLIIIFMMAFLSNLNIIPKSAPVYDTIWTYGVPIAVVLLLFNANLMKIFAESGTTLLAFCIGALGTTIGTILGVALLPLGESTPELAAVFSATYIGGSLNFAAVSEAIGFSDSTLLTASLAADNVVGTLFLGLLMAIPAIGAIARFFNFDRGHYEQLSKGYGEVPENEVPTFLISRATAALGLAFLIIAVSDFLSGFVNYPAARLLIATTLTVTVASIAHERLARIKEAFPIGMIVMYLFFGLIGAGVDIIAMLESGMVLAAFAAIILIVHIAFLLLIGRLCRLSLPEILIGSNACALGPPTAAAMAGAQGWNNLITPAVLCGTFGYAIANFVGLTLFASL